MSSTDPIPVRDEPTELVRLLQRWAYDNHWNEARNQPNWTAAAMELGVSRPRFTNWFKEAHGIALEGHPEDHRAIAATLKMSPREAARLNGIDVSDEIPEPANVGDSGASLNDGTRIFTPVTDIAAHRKRRRREQTGWSTLARPA